MAEGATPNRISLQNVCSMQVSMDHRPGVSAASSLGVGGSPGLSLWAVTPAVLVQLQHRAAHRLLALDLLELIRPVPIGEIQDGANHCDCENPEHSLPFLPCKAYISILPEIPRHALTKSDREIPI